jgi:hypothetical protein
MDTLAGTLGPDSMDSIIHIPIGNRFANLIGGLVGSFAQAGAAIADKQYVFDVAEVFDCHVE